MPEQQRNVQRQMGPVHRESDEVREQRQMGMRLEKFGMAREEPGLQDLFDSRQINLGVFDVGVVSVDEPGADGDQKDAENFPNFQTIHQFTDNKRKQLP